MPAGQADRPPAVFYDGASNRRHPVRLVIGTDLAMEEDGVTIARWAYGDIRRADGHGRLRLRCLSGPPLARLDIADEALAASLLARLPASGRDAGRGHGRARQIVGWSLAACVSILALVLYGIPFAAGRLAPLVPLSVEQRLGDATDTRLRAMLGGRVCARPDGAAALARMVEALGTAGGIARPVEVLVLSSPVANAVTLPGGRIYVFDGLLHQAETPDELAGLIAHEMGHVHNRDGLRTVIRAGGTSFLIGLLFGDVTGGAAVIFAANALLDAAHSRDAERAADDFAAATVTALGRPPAAFGRLLVRITGSDSRGTILDSHPVSAERLDRLAVAPGAAQPMPSGPALLDDAGWQALRQICADTDTGSDPGPDGTNGPARRSDKQNRP